MPAPELILTDELNQILAWPASAVRGEHLLIEATAGTGKTTALALLYDRLQRQGQQALVLTFSTRGEQRFREQYQACCRPELSGAALKSVAATFDAFALRCLRDHSTLKYWRSGATGHALQGDDRAYAAMLDAIHLLNAQRDDDDEATIGSSHDDVAYCLDLVDNLKISRTFFQSPFCNIDLDEADSFDQETIAYALQGLGLPPWAHRLYREYEKQRERLDFLRHGDAAHDLAAEPEAITAFLRAKPVSHVLVDEFHDTKAVHFEILLALARAGCRLVVVGDRGQDIFEWRGLAPFSAFEQFTDHLPLNQTLPLSITYRFGTPLAKSAGNLLKRIHADTAGIKARPKASTPVKTLSAGEDWTAATAKLINRLREDGVAGQDIAVIVPQPQLAYPLCSTLHAQNLPYRCEGIAPYHLAREALILRAGLLLAGWYQPKDYGYLDCRALTLLASMPRMPADKAATLQDMLRHYNYESGQFDYRTDQCSDALALLRLQLGQPTGACTGATLTGWLDQMGVWKWFYALAPTPAALKATRSALNQQAGRIVRQGATAYAQELDTLAERYFHNRQRLADKVVLTSVLQCKGNEWPYVILPAAGEQDWAPHFEVGASLQQSRELYVATTRAMDGLFLIRSQGS